MWRRLQISVLLQVDWEHMFLVLFYEWVIFCDTHLGASIMDSCKLCRVLSTELDCFVSFQAFIAGTSPDFQGCSPVEKTKTRLLSLYAVFLLTSTYVEAQFRKKYPRLLDFVRDETQGSPAFGDTNSKILLSTFMDSPASNTPQTCQIVANYFEKVRSELGHQLTLPRYYCQLTMNRRTQNDSYLLLPTLVLPPRPRFLHLHLPQEGHCQERCQAVCY